MVVEELGVEVLELLTHHSQVCFEKSTFAAMSGQMITDDSDLH